MTSANGVHQSLSALPRPLAEKVVRVYDEFEAALRQACREGATAPCAADYVDRVSQEGRGILKVYLDQLEQEFLAGERWPTSPEEVRASAAARLGEVFANYELLEVLGVGGQGIVYRARQVHIDKEVALKLVNPRDRRRALRELTIAASLEHAHLVRVFHVGEHSGLLYFTMKLAGKGSLARRLDAEYRLADTPPLTAAEQQAVARRKHDIARFLAKIARAVHFLHQQGIIHRDLKPANVLLDAHGEPLVTDLGLARHFGNALVELPLSTAADPDGADPGTGAGLVVGTPGYLAPEQALGVTTLTPAVDVWGLGALLYKLLTGRTPFVGTDKEMIAQAADPERLAPLPSVYNPNVGAGSDLELICRKCLVKDPDGRYASAAALADDLEHCAREDEISVRPRSWLERSTRAVVQAIDHKLPIPGIARWGNIDFWDAGLNLVVNVTLYALIRADQRPALLWLAQLTFIVVWWWVFLTYFFRHKQTEPTERHLALLWAGVTLAGITLFWLYCPPFGPGKAADLLAYYPPWTVVNGVAFLVVGRLYWGKYYLIGLAHFVVALLMPLRLDLAPLVYGVFVAIFMTLSGWDHYRTARQANE